jgi:hypothetical protein
MKIKAQINMSLKRALVVYLPVILVTILAIWISVFTHWNAMFYFGAIIVIVLPILFGLPLVRASQEKFRARAARYPRWMMPSIIPNSSGERMLFTLWRFIGWVALLFAASAIFFLISTIFSHRTS